MIARIVVPDCSADTRGTAAILREKLCTELRSEFAFYVACGTRPVSRCNVVFRLQDWCDDNANLFEYDAAIHRAENEDFDLVLVPTSSGLDCSAALEILTRYQRLLPLPKT